MTYGQACQELTDKIEALLAGALTLAIVGAELAELPTTGPRPWPPSRKEKRP